MQASPPSKGVTESNVPTPSSTVVDGLMIRARRLAPPRAYPRPDVLRRHRAEDLHTVRDMSASAGITQMGWMGLDGVGSTEPTVRAGATRVARFVMGETAYALVVE